MLNTRIFQGAFPALITPLTKDESLDAPALRRIIDFAITRGVNGILVLGSTGEGPVLSAAVQEDVVAQAVQFSAGRVPVVAGTGGLSTRHAVSNTLRAKELGADGVIIVPPFYFGLSTAGVIRYFQQIADEVDIPIIIYNIPQRTQVPVSAEAVASLSSHPNIIGLKDSSGDFLTFLSMMRAASGQEFNLFQGRAPLVLAGLQAGAKGWITPVGNVDPGTDSALYRSWLAGDLQTARTLQDRMTRLAQVFGYGSLAVGVNVKAILSQLGVCENVLVHPSPVVEGEKLAALVARIKTLGLEDVLDR